MRLFHKYIVMEESKSYNTLNRLNIDDNIDLEEVKDPALVGPSAGLHVPDGVDAPLGEPHGPLPVGRVGSRGPADRPLAVIGVGAGGDGLVLALAESGIGSVPGDIVRTEER